MGGFLLYLFLQLRSTINYPECIVLFVLIGLFVGRFLLVPTEILPLLPLDLPVPIRHATRHSPS